MFSSAWCCLQTGGMQFVCGRVGDRETGVTHMSGGIGMAAGYRPSVHIKHKPKVAQTDNYIGLHVCTLENKDLFSAGFFVDV